MTGKIHSYETLGAVDGPGLRFVLFLQGCRLRCRYCHNPDTWDLCGGYRATAAEIAGQVLKYRNYFGKHGGITVSGGEPLLQLDFLIELFGLLRTEGISTAIDTSGAEYDASDPAYDRLLPLTDLVLLDIKHIDAGACQALTGKDNAATLAFAERLSQEQIPVWIRQVLVPGVTDDPAALRETRCWIDTLNNVERVEVLPYHTLGVKKYESLGIPYAFEGVSPPTADAVEQARKILIG